MALDGRYIWRLSSNSRAAMRRLRVGVGVGRVEHHDEGGAAQYEASTQRSGRSWRVVTTTIGIVAEEEVEAAARTI